VFTNSSIFGQNTGGGGLEPELEESDAIISVPAEFIVELMDLLGRGLHWAEEPTEYLEDEKYPKEQVVFTERKAYAAFRLELEADIYQAGIADMVIYQVQNGPMQATVITVVPRGVNPGEQLAERFELMLGTVNLDKEPPAQAPSGSPAGQAAPGSSF